MPIKLKLTADEHTALPEGQRSLYVAKDDAFVLDVDTDEVEAQFAPALKKALQVERESARAGKRAEVELSNMRKVVGQLTADELQERLQAADRLQADVTKLVEQERAKFSGALRDRAIAEAVAKAKGTLPLLAPMLRDRVRVTPEGAVQVLDDDRQPTDTTLDAYVAALRDNPDFGGAFAASGNSGTGGAGESRAPAGASGPAGGALPAGTRRRDMTRSQKAAFMREHGSAAYLALPA